MSAVVKMEQIDTEIMEAHIVGDSFSYRENNVQKYAYKCTGCGLVWRMKWYAEDCETRGHKTSFEQKYYSSRLNSYGKPYPPTVYTRYAMRRDKGGK